jgi:nucleotide-binding universal stress UspA family protein
MALMFRKILVPVDLTEPDMMDLGIDEAVALANLSDGELRLVNVHFFVPAVYADFVPTNFGDRLRVATEQQMVKLADQIDYKKERISTSIRFGEVYPELLNEAEDWGADLIVLGSHRPSRATYLIGSNAATIVRHAKCSVLVVRK